MIRYNIALGKFSVTLGGEHVCVGHIARCTAEERTANELAAKRARANDDDDSAIVVRVVAKHLVDVGCVLVRADGTDWALPPAGDPERIAWLTACPPQVVVMAYHVSAGIVSEHDVGK
jgi:hypothetical protein